MKDFTQAIGKPFFYLGHEHVIRDAFVEEATGKLKVTTNKKTIRIDPEEFGKTFLPVDNDDDRDQAIMVYHGMDIDAQDMRSLSAVLMDNIKKVQSDSKYIESAKAINDSAKTLIELQKTKLEMIRLVREVKV